MSSLIRSAALLSLGLAAACATTEPGAPPATPSADARRQYGDVSVVLVPDRVEYVINTPTSGWAKGLFMGTARGLVAIPTAALGGALVGLQGSQGGRGLDVTIVMGAAIGGAMATAYFPYSVINGALTAVPRAEVDAALPVFREAFEDPTLKDRLLVEFSRRAELHLPGPLVPVDEATTVMEIRLLSIRSGSPNGLTTLDDDFDVVAVASVRVVRRADEHIVSESVATDDPEDADDGGHTFLVWASQDAELLRNRLDAAMVGLAESLAQAVFVAQAEVVGDDQPPPLFTPDEIDLIWSASP